MSSKTKKYTSRTLTELVRDAVVLGIQVHYHVDMDGKYVIIHRVVAPVPGRTDLAAARDDIYTPDNVAMAHWLILGMMAQSKSQLANIQALKNSGI